MKDKELDERRDDHHGAEEDRRCAGEEGDDEKESPRDFDRAGDVAEPLPDSNFMKEPDHVGPADQLRAADEKENGGQCELDELEEYESSARSPVQRPLRPTF
jgi:hypothetical protein